MLQRQDQDGILVDCDYHWCMPAPNLVSVEMPGHYEQRLLMPMPGLVSRCNQHIPNL
jgi:hypothetical protein